MLGFVCDVMSYICLEILIAISGAKNYLCPSAFVEPSHLILMFPFYCFSHPQVQSLFKKKKKSVYLKNEEVKARTKDSFQSMPVDWKCPLNLEHPHFWSPAPAMLFISFDLK